MQQTIFARIQAIILLGAVSFLPSVVSATAKPAKTSLRFLARGTAIYSSFSGSQSEYLVEIQSSKQTPFLARLLYRHSFTHAEIPNELIDSGKAFYFQLTRAAECDQSYGTLSTRWLPGEGESLRAHNGLWFISGGPKPAIDAAAVLPCYLLSPHEIHSKGHYQRAQ